MFLQIEFPVDKETEKAVDGSQDLFMFLKTDPTCTQQSKEGKFL